MKKRMCGGKSILALTLAAVLTLGASFQYTIVFSQESISSPIAVSEMKVNDLVSPMGIDQNPIFRWINQADGYSRAQSAYRIIVSSTYEKAQVLNGDCWDSQKVSGDDSIEIAYQGNALQSRTQYFWRVIVWDETDTAGDWSDIQSFETGILNQSEWTAKWIGATYETTSSLNINLSGANWIWLKKGVADHQVPECTMFFRKSITPNASKKLVKAVVGFSTDDYGTFYVNGKNAAEVPNVTSAWQTGAVADITELMLAGKNQIAVSVTNAFTSYAGFIAKVELRYDDGSRDTIVTDSTWKLSDSPNNGWTDSSYDDSGWATPDMIITYGTGAWGSNVKLPDGVQSSGAPMLRRSFEVSKEVQSARAYICGLGLFDMKINGQFADDTVLNPAHTQYEKTVMYRVFDVTSLLTQGKNSISVMLGNSFFNEGTTPWLWQMGVWKDKPKMIMELDIRYTDGSSDKIITDQTWKSFSDGPMVYDSIYYGEIYDARKDVVGWEDTGFDDSAWVTARLAEPPTGSLTFQNIEPMRKLKTYKPTITYPRDGITIVGISEITAGWAKFRFNAPEGTKITMHYGEQLNADGTLKSTTDLVTYWKPLQLDTYICKGQPNEIYEPRFNYDGYQYIQIEGYPGILTEDDVECYTIHNDVKVISQLETGNALVNKMHDNMVRTILNNFHSKPTDTPLFEKNGWTGDNNVGMESVAYNIDISAFIRKYMGDAKDAQRADGILPDIVPTTGWFYDQTVVWNGVYTTGVQELSQKFGQNSSVTAHYDSMRKQALFYKNKGQQNNWRFESENYTDWCVPSGGSNPNIGITPPNPEGSGVNALASVYKMFRDMKDFAEKLGKSQDAAEYQAVMDTIYTKITEYYYNPQKQIYETGKFNPTNPNLTEYRQTANIIVLGLGLVPEQYISGVVKNLVQDIVSKNYHLDTGIVGTKWILPVLTQYGYTDVAYKVLLQTTYPSWGFWAENGTTVWESWESTTRSRSHFFLGTYDEWLFKDMMGIRKIREGYKTFDVKPKLSDDIGWANSSIQTIRGTVESNWKINGDGSINLSVTVPVGSTATIFVPCDDMNSVTLGQVAITEELPGVQSIATDDSALKVEVGSGKYEFRSIYDPNSINHQNLVIQNRMGIDSAAIVNGKTYALPVNEMISGGVKNIQIVSNNADYDFAYWSGNVFDTKNPIALTEINAPLVPVFQYIGGNSENAEVILSLDAEDGTEILVNGSIVSLPYSKAFAKGTQVVLDVIPPDSREFVGWENTSLGIPGVITLTGDVSFVPVLRDVALKGNLALGKAVSSNDCAEIGDAWGAKNLTNGQTIGSGFTSNQPTVSPDVSNNPKWVEIDLGRDEYVDQVILYPRTDGLSFAENRHYFPQDFTISVKADGENTYHVVKTITGHPDTAEPVTLGFDRIKARYIRLTATKLAANATAGDYYRLQLAEMEVYGIADNMPEKVSEILIKSDTNTIKVGETLTLNALVLPEMAKNLEIMWIVQDVDTGGLSDKASLIINDNTAVLTGLSKGQVNVVARACDGRGAIANYRVAIENLADNAVIASVLADGSGNVTVSVNSNITAGIVFIASYDADGKLVKITEAQPLEAAIKDYTFNISNVSGACKVKAFIWRDMQNMIPLAVTKEA